MEKQDYKKGRNYNNTVVLRLRRQYSESEAVLFLVNGNRELRHVVGMLESEVEEQKDTIKQQKQELEALRNELADKKKPKMTVEESQLASYKKQLSLLQSRLHPSAKTINLFCDRITALRQMGLEIVGEYMCFEGDSLIHYDELRTADDDNWEMLLAFVKSRIGTDNGRVAEM